VTNASRQNHRVYVKERQLTFVLANCIIKEIGFLKTDGKRRSIVERKN